MKKFLSTIGLLSLFALATTAHAVGCVQPPVDMVAWWDADDIVGNSSIDVSGNGNHGTIGAGDSAPNIVPGKVGNAFEFFQTFSVVESSGFSPGGIVGMNAESGGIDMWSKPNWNGNDGLRHGLFQTSNDTASANQFRAIKENDNNLYFFFRRNGVDSSISVNAGSVFVNGQWVHLTFTWDSALAAIYADGVLVASVSNPTLPAVYSSSVPRRTILGRLAELNTKFDGLLDEVEFFTRALTASEIQSIVTADTAGKCKDGEPDVPTCNGLPATIIGTSGDDLLMGTNGDDVIVGLGGNDVLRGKHGNDVLCGNEGNDELRGGLGADILFGQEGDDALIGGRGSDQLFGGSGNDELHGQRGSDVACGGTDDDTLYGGKGADRMDGGTGGDTMKGGKASDICANGESLQSCEDTSTAVPECADE